MHTGSKEKVLKKLTMVYIKKCLTLEYTAQFLNLFNAHSFFNVGLTLLFFLLIIICIFNTHTHVERAESFKETDSGIYPKISNSLISICNQTLSYIECMY